MPPDSGTIGFSFHIMQLTLDDNTYNIIVYKSYNVLLCYCVYGALATAHLQSYSPSMLTSHFRVWLEPCNDFTMMCFFCLIFNFMYGYEMSLCNYIVSEKS